MNDSILKKIANKNGFYVNKNKKGRKVTILPQPIIINRKLGKTKRQSYGRPKNEIKQLHKDIRNIKLGSTPRRENGTSTTSYFNGLMNPESVYNLKVPGKADSTIALRRKVTVGTVAGTLGALGIVWQPNYLSDNTNATSTLFIDNNTSFDGILTTGLTLPLAVVPSLSVTAGAVAQYRLVSACMHVIPQSSVLNQAGTIHGSLVKISQQQMRGSGNAMDNVQNAANIVLIPNYESSPYYQAASVSAMQGLRVVWVPNDPCLLEFCDINENMFVQDGASQNANTIVATVVGAAPGAPFRIDLYYNYEVVPQPGSILQGMETMCPYNEVAESIWWEVLFKHKNEIVIASDAISQVNSSNIDKKYTDGLQLAAGLRNQFNSNELPSRDDYIRKQLELYN